MVPAEMLSKPRSDEDPMLTAVIGDYQRETSITDSDDELFKMIKVEVVAVLMWAVNFTWAEGYVRSLKTAESTSHPARYGSGLGPLGGRLTGTSSAQQRMVRRQGRMLFA